MSIYLKEGDSKELQETLGKLGRQYLFFCVPGESVMSTPFVEENGVVLSDRKL